MNHIHRLQHERDITLEQLNAMQAAIQSFRVHLDGPKFQGFESDGGRRDWIAVNDVLAWLRTIETAGEHADATADPAASLS